MKVVFSSWNTLTNEAFGMYSIGQIDESNYLKLEHPNKWSTLNAYNLPIDECIFCMMFSSWKNLINKDLECIQLTNKWK